MMSTEPRYARMFEALNKRITGGEFAVGDYLPSEHSLAIEYAISRPTVRRALEQLEDIGLIERRRGDGTKVLSVEPATGLHYTTRPADDLLYGRGAERTVREIGMVVADTDLAAQLDDQPGRRWLHIQQHRCDRDSGEIVVWGNVYVDEKYRDIANGVADYGGFICDLIEERYGVTISDIHQELIPIIIPDDIAITMGLQTGALGLQMTRRYRNSQKKAIEISVNIFATERTKYHFILNRTRKADKA
ncbi:GntR family transcriptional regulator [Alphaproteobacteria bacterium]|nr:GntR family transcriptional regulator [Alphaproteobacteria bacterium]